ncbi:MAG: VWA domain-containing protein [Candidatus Cloacimonadaceae bacterium]|nr:VWA domain-containing protein [Candidatus Cloacimonadaceae bacterium]
MKNIELGACSPFGSFFGEPKSLREVIKAALSYVKSSVVGDKSIKTIIKGITKPDDTSEDTFDVELKLNEIKKIGLKRKKLTSFKNSALMSSAGAPVVFWTSRYSSNGRPDLYQSLKAAIMEGSFVREPFHIEIARRHFRYPVYQQKQNFNIMLVLDISNSVKWILKFIDKIIAMLTAQACAAKDKLGLIIFNDDRAQIMHYPTSNIRQIVGTINTLSPKGKTPLAQGVKLALQTLQHSRFQVTGMANAIVLLSDCFPEPITGEYADQMDEPACQELLHVADRVADAKIKLLILNPSVRSTPHYEKLIGFRLGTLAAERANGSFLNLVADMNQSAFSDRRDYELSPQMLSKFKEGISEFRMDNR